MGATKKRRDRFGHVLYEGESQNKSTKLYAYRWTDEETGKRRAVYSMDLADLRQKEKQLKEDRKDGIRTFEAANTTLNQLFTLYLETKTDLRDSTRMNYIHVWDKRVKDSAVANMTVDEIRQIHIKKFYTGLLADGMSDGTVKLIHNMIFPALEMAVENDLIRKNPSKGARRGVKGVTRERKALTAEQQERFVDFMMNDARFSLYANMIDFALNTGLRVGELTGLCWRDIDMKGKVAHITRQLIYKNLDGSGCKFFVGDLKTEAGRRDVPIMQEAMKALKGQQEFDRIFRKVERRQEVCGMSDYVFTNNQGRPFATNAVNLVLKNIVNKYNEEIAETEEDKLPAISAHILRHSFCSRMVERGADVKSLQYCMGHEDAGITLNTYTDFDFTEIQKHMDRVDRNTAKIIEFKVG